MSKSLPKILGNPEIGNLHCNAPGIFSRGGLNRARSSLFRDACFVMPGSFLAPSAWLQCAILLVLPLTILCCDALLDKKLEAALLPAAGSQAGSIREMLWQAYEQYSPHAKVAPERASSALWNSRTACRMVPNASGALPQQQTRKPTPCWSVQEHSRGTRCCANSPRACTTCGACPRSSKQRGPAARRPPPAARHPRTRATALTVWIAPQRADRRHLQATTRAARGRRAVARGDGTTAYSRGAVG